MQAADFTAHMGPQELLHWRLFFQHLLSHAASAVGSEGVIPKDQTASGSAQQLWESFQRLSSQPKLQVSEAICHLLWCLRMHATLVAWDSQRMGFPEKRRSTRSDRISRLSAHTLAGRMSWNEYFTMSSSYWESMLGSRKGEGTMRKGGSGFFARSTSSSGANIRAVWALHL